MAFCMWRIHSGVSKPACKFILPNCSLSKIVLRDVCKVSASTSRATYSALLSRSDPGHNDKTSNDSGQLNSHTLKNHNGWSTKDNRQCIKDPNSHGKLPVNLCELFACDPLAILLHSRLQVYNNSYLGKHEEETNKTKSQKIALQPAEQSVQPTCITTSCGWLHYTFAEQQNTLLLSTTSFCDDLVRALFPTYHKAMLTSCAIESVVYPPSPNHTDLAGSALYQNQVLSTPSPCHTAFAGSAFYQDQAFGKSALHHCVPPMSQPSISHCSGDAHGTKGGGGGKVDSRGLPTPEQLCHVHDTLIKSLKNIFKQSPNYTIYDQNIIFENRIRGTVTKGIGMYAVQSSLLVTFGHLKYAKVTFDIIKITQHPEEGTIKVRWRIKGVKSRQAIVGFLKAPKWSLSSMMEQADVTNWYDGFSTFYVNSAGLVSRHVADNMMPDDAKLSTRQKTGVFGRLAVLFGLLPKAGHGNAMMGVQPSDIY